MKAPPDHSFLCLLNPGLFRPARISREPGLCPSRRSRAAGRCLSCGSAVVFCLAFLFYRNATKAALAAGFLLGFYFFFGAIQDFLKAHLHPLSRYAVHRTGPRDRRHRLDHFPSPHPSRLLSPDGSIYRMPLFPDIPPPGIRTGRYPHVSAATTGCRNTRIRIDRRSTSPYTWTEKPDIYFLLFDAYTSSIG